MKLQKRTTQIVSMLLALICVGTLLTGCRGNTPGGNTSTGDTVSLTVWGAQEDQEMLRRMCEAFAAANPDNKYEFHYGVQGEDQVAEKVLADPTSGPDVYSFAGDQIGKLYAGGALARVGGELEETVKAEHNADAVDAATLRIGGEDMLMAYPATGDNCYFLYYDKRVFDTEDVADLDRMLTVAEEAGKTLHFKLNDDGWYLSSFFFADPTLKYEVTYNENMAEQSVSINFNSPAGLAVMQALRSYVNRDGLLAVTDDSKMIAALRDGSAAAIVTGTWNASVVQEILGEHMGVSKLPVATIGGQSMQLSGFMGYKMIGVGGYSKNKGEAHKLAQWLTNEENQLTRYRTRGFAPTNQAVASRDDVLSDPIIQAVFEQAKHNRTQTGVPTTYWTPMGALITPLINAKAQGTTVSDAQLQEYLDALNTQISRAS